MQLKLPKLPYQMNALEPHLDANALEIHYRKHHSGYLQKLNDALRQLRLEDVPLEEILANVSQYPPSIRNYAGGFYNHSLFWQMLTPDYQELNDINLTDAIIKYFGTFEKMKEEFTTVALNQFGSGWAWLVKRGKGELLAYSTANQNNPLMDTTPFRGKPVLCIDLWEHSYQSQYHDNRKAYIESFWNIVNWKKVAELYNK